MDVERLKNLHRPSALKWGLHAALNWAELILILHVISIFHNPLAYWLGSVVLGFRMHGLALLGHEGIHGNVAKNKTLNNILASVICAYPVIQSLGVFRWFHLEHHQNIGQKGRDPELDFRFQHENRWATPVTHTKLLRLLALDLMGLGVWEARYVFLHNKELKAWDLLQPALFWIFVWFIFAKLNLLWIPLVWTWALFTSYWASFRLRALSEHLDTTDTHRFHATLFERWLFMPHSCWYHYEHHKWPKIPFYNLHKARELDSSVPVMPKAFHYL